MCSSESTISPIVATRKRGRGRGRRGAGRAIKLSTQYFCWQQYGKSHTAADTISTYYPLSSECLTVYTFMKSNSIKYLIHSVLTSISTCVTSGAPPASIQILRTGAYSLHSLMKLIKFQPKCPGPGSELFPLLLDTFC